MNKKNAGKEVILFVVFVLISFAMGVFVINAKNQALLNIEFQDKLTNARFADKKITELFSELYKFYNYDEINKEQNTFETAMKQTGKIIKNDFFFGKKKLQAIYKRVNEKFEEKKSFIGKFKSYNAVLNNSYRFISTLYEQISQSKTNSYNKLLVSGIYSDMIALQLGDSNKKELQKNIAILKTIKNNQNINNFLNHATTILNFDERLKKIIRSNKALALDEDLQEFSNLANGYFTQTVKLINFLSLLMIVLVIYFAYLIWVIYKGQTRDKTALANFRKSVEDSDNVVMITDNNFVVNYVNDTFEKVTGYAKQEILGKTPKLLRSGKNDADFYKRLNRSLREKKSFFGEFINKKKNGTLFYEKTTISPILNKKGDVESYIAIKLDVSKDKEYQRQIELKNKEISKRYYTDNLTSLPNRNKLLEDINAQKPCVFVLIKIDNFDEIRFFYGFKNVDCVLQEMAGFLLYVGKKLGNLYKLRDSEFCFLSTQLDTNQDLINIIDKVLADLNSHTFLVQNQALRVTTTIGISKSQETDKNLDDGLIHAELAHRYAKEHNIPYAAFDDRLNMADKYKNNIIWAQKISDALKENRIIAYFQPIVDANSKVSSYETLVRLIEKDGSVISPFHFLDIAKKSNQYTKITKTVIEQAFDKFKDIDCKFSVNIDVEDIESDEIRELLRQRLSNFAYPFNFTVEFLETASMVDYNSVRNFIEELKGYNARIAIDDFGSGYSNFERVVNLNVDYIKIDGSIIRYIDKDENMKKIAQSIVFFAKSINKKVVGEFVSSKEILEEAKRIGIDFFQGFYFSEPQKTLWN